MLTLSIARVVQGFGAAGIMSVSPALVRFTYPHRHLGRAIGINAFVVATSAALGPTIAAAVLAVAHWRWLFGINVPLGLITICIAFASLPETERARRPLNYAGAALYAGAFGLLVSGLQSLAHQGSRALALLQLACGAALAWLLVRHERPRAAPLIPFDLLRIRILSLSLLTSVCAFMAQTAALVALPFEIQRLGHSAVATGLLMTPWPLALAVAAPLAGHLADRYAAGALGASACWCWPRAWRCSRLLPAHAAAGPRLAHDAVRAGIRLLPGAEQSHHTRGLRRASAAARPAGCWASRGCSGRRWAPPRSRSCSAPMPRRDPTSRCGRGRCWRSPAAGFSAGRLSRGSEAHA